MVRATSRSAFRMVSSLALGAAMAVACEAERPPAEPTVSSSGPDVFVIVLDAASRFYFGLYGDVHGTSPNLDRFASEAVVFDQAYSQSATTTPSTASLLTGVRVMTHRTSGTTVLPSQFKTVAQLFGERGYRSIALISNPHAGAPQLELDRGYDQAVMLYSEAELRPGTKRDNRSRFGVVLPEDIDAALGEILPRLPASQTYAYLHYLQPHKPYDAPPQYLDRVTREEDLCECEGAACACGSIGWHALHDEFLKANETGVASQSVIEHLKARYRANILYVDEYFGRLIDGLRENGLYEDSLIIVLSDHGDAFFGHRRFGHNRTLYDDMVRIPLLMKFPASAKVEPRRFSALVETVDIVPTIFDFLGFPRFPQWEGESLWPLISGAEDEPKDAHREVVLATNRRDKQALRLADFKYIRSQDGREELYDLRSDPQEQDDLSARQPEKTRALRERLESVVAAGGQVPLARESELRNDPEMDRLLEALGYIRGDDEPASPPGEEAPAASP